MKHMFLFALFSLLFTSNGAQEQPIYDEALGVESFVDMYYPPIAVDARVQGVVVVSLRLNNDGTVAAASALSGPKVLVEPTVENARKWRFRFKKEPQKAAVIVYEFRLSGPCHHQTTLFELVHFNFARISACSTMALLDQIR